MNLKNHIKMAMILFMAIFTNSMILHAAVTDTAREEKIYFSSADGAIRFGGSFTYIPGKKSPAVVLLSGTGKQDRDFTWAKHKLFKKIADSLTRTGIAVLRFDDRGTGESQGDYDTCSTYDFALDALAALQYVRSRNEVDTSLIGLAGHSEGGAAAVIAASMNASVKFVISLAGLQVTGLQAVKFQNNRMAETMAPKEYLPRYHSINAIIFDTVYKYINSPLLDQQLRSTYTAWKKVDDSLFKKHFPGKYDSFRFGLEPFARQVQTKWYRYNIQYDPAAFLRKLRVPVLGIYGADDIMTDADSNLQSMTANIISYNNTASVTLIKLKGVNHLLQYCPGCSMQQGAESNSTIDPLVLKNMISWIRSISH